MLGFQHFIVMLGTSVIIPSALVPQMGGGNVSSENNPLVSASLGLHVALEKIAKICLCVPDFLKLPLHSIAG